MAKNALNYRVTLSVVMCMYSVPVAYSRWVYCDSHQYIINEEINNNNNVTL